MPSSRLSALRRGPFAVRGSSRQRKPCLGAVTCNPCRFAAWVDSWKLKVAARWPPRKALLETLRKSATPG